MEFITDIANSIVWWNCVHSPTDKYTSSLAQSAVETSRNIPRSNNEIGIVLYIGYVVYRYRGDQMFDWKNELSTVYVPA